MRKTTLAIIFLCSSLFANESGDSKIQKEHKNTQKEHMVDFALNDYVKFSIGTKIDFSTFDGKFNTTDGVMLPFSDMKNNFQTPFIKLKAEPQHPLIPNISIEHLKNEINYETKEIFTFDNIDFVDTSAAFNKIDVTNTITNLELYKSWFQNDLLDLTLGYQLTQMESVHKVENAATLAVKTRTLKDDIHMGTAKLSLFLFDDNNKSNVSLDYKKSPTSTSSYEKLNTSLNYEMFTDLLLNINAYKQTYILKTNEYNSKGLELGLSYEF